eukprot:320014_1
MGCLLLSITILLHLFCYAQSETDADRSVAKFVFQQISFLNTEVEALEFVHGMSSIRKFVRHEKSVPRSEYVTLMQQMYMRILLKYEQFDSCLLLKQLMIAIAQENLAFTVLNTMIWNQFFTLYFHSDLIKTDMELYIYLQAMQMTNVEPDITTFMIITDGLNTNKHIQNPQAATRALFRFIPNLLHVDADMTVYEQMMDSLAHTN